MLKCSRRSDIATFHAMAVLVEANRLGRLGKNILHLEAGEPAYGPPQSALDAAMATLDGRRHGYTTSMGMPVLREKIADHYRTVHALEIDPERVAVTAGASTAFVLTFLAAFDEGDRVAFGEPGYPAYRNTLNALGIDAVPILTTLENGFQPTIAELESLEKPIDGLVIGNPANPTGSMLLHEDLQALAGYCDDQGIRLITDEIYHGVTFGTPAETALRCSDHAIVINSFSKYYCMTGWRVGWAVLPDALVPSVNRLSANLFIAPTTISQQAAMGALDAYVELATRVGTYRGNRDLLLDTLSKVGLNRVAPAQGGFYLYVDVSQITDDSMILCNRLLNEIGVAVTPGIDFDQKRGQHYVRLSFAGSRDTIQAAAKRLERWFDGDRKQEAA